jgi:UDP-GlcNAc:undecaprenyl-phosphate GlcNAc-1-phosphate transferase
VAIRLAPSLKLVDQPNSAPHKVHFRPVPAVGGLILFSTVIIVSLAIGLLSQPQVPGILAAAAIIFCFGLWDDIANLRPAWKLTGQFLATIVMIAFGVQVRLFQQEWLNYAITFFWMIGVINAYNFVDSMDGLAVGLAALASAFFMLITIESQQEQLSQLSMILLGASIATYFFNAPPATVFLGDSGAQLIGLLLGAMGIAYNPVGYSPFSSWYIPILLMGVPIFDTTLVVFSRLRRRLPVYQASRDHTYHRLVARGVSSNRAVLTMHLVALLLGCLAFVALKLPPLYSNIIFALVLLLGAGAILALDYKYGPSGLRPD